MGVCFGGVEGCDEHSANRAAIMHQCFVRIRGNNACLLRDFEPVFCFVAFFQCNMQLCDKVRTAVGIFGFSNVGTDACSASLQLVDKE